MSGATSCWLLAAGSRLEGVGGRRAVQVSNRWLPSPNFRLEIQNLLLEAVGGRDRCVKGEHSVNCTHGRDVRPYESRLTALLISSLIPRAVPIFALCPLPSALGEVPA